MSNKLWVTWKKPSDVDGSGDEYLYNAARVFDLADDAIVDDLCVEFGKQQIVIGVGTGTIEVFSLMEGQQTRLNPGDRLLQYFIANGDSEEKKKQPGKSAETALFLTLPPPQQHNNTPQFFETVKAGLELMVKDYLAKKKREQSYFQKHQIQQRMT